jgi:hypothetical protein
MPPYPLPHILLIDEWIKSSANYTDLNGTNRSEYLRNYICLIELPNYHNYLLNHIQARRVRDYNTTVLPQAAV